MELIERRKNQVTEFYKALWERRDLNAISGILTEGVAFRGSLGEEERGHRGFINYLERVHEALGQYRCQIDTLVAEPDKAFVKVLFSGVHRNIFLGFEPSGARLSWHGCALFSFSELLIREVLVLGDLVALETLLAKNANPSEH